MQMGRKPNNPKRDVPVLLRLTSEESAVLDAVAHLESTTVAGLLYRLAQAEILRAEKNEFVQTHVANKRAFEASKQGDLVDLSERRRGGRPS